MPGAADSYRNPSSLEAPRIRGSTNKRVTQIEGHGDITDTWEPGSRKAQRILKEDAWTGRTIFEKRSEPEAKPEPAPPAEPTSEPAPPEPAEDREPETADRDEDEAGDLGISHAALATLRSLRDFVGARMDPFQAFTARTWLEKKVKDKAAKEKRGKLIRYDKADQKTQRGLDASRKKEWENWKRFNAASVISFAKGQELIKQGHQVLPMQWVELDKKTRP